MSIPVSLERLRAASEERGPSAYVLTVGADERPHAVHAPVRWEGPVVAAEVGKSLAAAAKSAGLESAVFDRGGYLYHGRVKALADAAREGGLKF